MKKFKLNKLVRDQIYDEMLSSGQNPKSKSLNDNEFKKELINKLLEEVRELNISDSDIANELADIVEVVEEIAKINGKNLNHIIEVQKLRRQQRGGFDKKILVHELNLEDSDPWVQYYSKDPKRFPRG